MKTFEKIHSVRRAAQALVCCLVMALLTPVQAYAAEEASAPRTVFLFDQLCYEMLPDLASLETRAAKLKWTPVTGAKLQAFKPSVEPKQLKAWLFKDLGVGFQIAVTQSDMDEQSKKDFPKYADAQSYACSLILPAKSPRADISASMAKLMERKADETFDQGRMVFDTWGGETEKLKVIINHIGAKSGGPGGLLSITLMLKP